MIASIQIDIPTDELAEICRRYQVRELSLFGSVLRDDFHEASDIDVLVEFEPGAPIGLFEFVELKRILSDLFQHPVDLVEKVGLKQFVRTPVLNSAKVIYAA